MPLDLRISTPESFYDQLDQPQTDRLSVVLTGLIRVLNLSPSPGHRYVELGDISDAMIQASNTVLEEERDLVGITTRVVELMRRYPWLQGFTRYEDRGAPISVRDLDIWASNHVFDDWPGLFGITQHESHVFRGAFHGKSYPEEVNLVVRQLEIAD